uniref:Putative secreted protein n=1 Tax=Amblyomma cajennense TaxID=34607 RepID=A0A023FDK0_AMBCJ
MLFIFIMKVFCFSRQHALYIAADFGKITCHLSLRIMALPPRPAKWICQVKTPSFFVITLAPYGWTLLRFRKQLSKLLPKLNVCSFLPTHCDLACMAVFACEKLFLLH